jgi:multiple sugar transport system substrate-binding protein
MVFLCVAILGFSVFVATGEKPFEGVTIKVACDGGQNILPIEEAVDDIYDLSGITVVPIATTMDDLYQKLTSEFIADTGAFDLVTFFPMYGAEFASLGYLEPLDQYLDSTDPEAALFGGPGFLDDIATAFRYLYLYFGGELYSLPYDGDVHLYYYRKDLYEHPDEKAAFLAKYGYELAPPDTWEQQLDIAEFFTRKAGDKLAGETLKDDFYGYGFMGLNFWAKQDWKSHFAGRGGLWFDPETMEPGFNNEAGVGAVKDMMAFIPYAPPDFLSWWYEDLFNAFLGGRLGSMLIWSDVWKKTWDASMSTVVGKAGVSHVPGYMVDGELVYRAAMPFGRVMGIPKGSSNPEAALWVARYLSVVASQDFVMTPKTGEDPFRYTHFNNAAGLSAALEDFAGVPVPVDECQAYLDAVNLNLTYGFPDLNVPGTAQYEEALDLAIVQALAGQITPEQAMAQAAAAWEDITDALGRDNQKAIYTAMLDEWARLGYYNP